MLRVIGVQEYELDYISLSYCNSARDVYECRALLDSLHLTQTKIVAKVGWHIGDGCTDCLHQRKVLEGMNTEGSTQGLEGGSSYGGAAVAAGMLRLRRVG